MNNSIQSFNNKAFGTIRTMVDENGEPMFVGKDVAKALGYRNTREALQDHMDEEDKGVAKRDVKKQRPYLVWTAEGLEFVKRLLNN